MLALQQAGCRVVFPRLVRMRTLMPLYPNCKPLYMEAALELLLYIFLTVWYLDRARALAAQCLRQAGHDILCSF